MVGEFPTKFFKAISCISTLKMCGLSLVTQCLRFSECFCSSIATRALMHFAFDATVLLLTRAFGF